jgi:hypothetical protein
MHVAPMHSWVCEDEALAPGTEQASRFAVSRTGHHRLVGRSPTAGALGRIAQRRNTGRTRHDGVEDLGR